MKKRRKEKKVEMEFLSSMIFLMLSLCASLTVFLVYKPTKSFNVDVQDTLAEKIPTVRVPVVKHIAEHVQSAPPAKSEPKVIAQTQNSPSLADASDLVKKAVEMVNQSQVSEAKQLLEQVLHDNPDNEEALTQLGLIHLLDYKDEKVAQTYFEKILSINPDNKIALAELVDIYSDSADASGVKYLESLYEKNPNTSIALGIGQVLIENNPKAAIPYLEKGGDFALNDLGDAYTMSGNHAKALETFQIQEEKAKAKLQTSDAESAEYAKDELVRVMVNQYHALKSLGKDDLAQQKQNEIRTHIGKDADLLSFSDQPKHPKHPVSKQQ